MLGCSQFLVNKHMDFRSGVNELLRHKPKLPLSSTLLPPSFLHLAQNHQTSHSIYIIQSILALCQTSCRQVITSRVIKLGYAFSNLCSLVRVLRSLTLIRNAAFINRRYIYFGKTLEIITVFIDPRNFCFLDFCTVVYNYSPLNWQKPFELILIIKKHCIRCFSSVTFYFRRDLPFPRRGYIQWESQNWATVVSGSDLQRSVLQTLAQSRSNLKDKSHSLGNCAAEFGKPSGSTTPLPPCWAAVPVCKHCHGGKKKFLTPNRSFHCWNLWPVLLDISLWNSEKILLLSSLKIPVSSGRLL